MVGALAKQMRLSIQQQLFPHGSRVRIQAQVFWICFSTLPLILIFQIFKLSTKASFAKAACDTLR